MLICIKIVAISNVKIFRSTIHFLKIIFHLLANEIMCHFLFGSASTRVLVIRYASRTNSLIGPTMRPPIKIDFP